MKGLDARHYLLRVSLLRDQVPSFDEFPFCLQALRGLDTLDMHPVVTFLIGDNGTGKSTLMEAIAIAWGFNPEGGSTNLSFSTRASHSNLHERLRLARSLRRPRDGFFLRAKSFFNLATEIERLDQIDCPEPSVISRFGGESFLALLTHRLRGGGLYLLDEPEAALSPMRQMAALTRIHDLVGLDAQFIIATHSPILMAYPNATIYQLSENGCRLVQYTDTEYYTVTKAFLNKHEDMLRTLME